MQQAINDRQSSALRLGFSEFTTTERTIFDTVYTHYPHAVAVSVVEAAINVSHKSINVHTWRLRKKLEAKGWHIIAFHGSLRLVEPTPIA